MARCSILVDSPTLARLFNVVVSISLARFSPLGVSIRLARFPPLGVFTSSAHATCVIPNFASLYSGATGKPSIARHALYKSTRKRFTMYRIAIL